MGEKYKQLTEDAQRVLNVTDLSSIKHRSVMITGASGLIGTHLLYSIEEYIKRGGSLKKCYALIYNEPPEHIACLSKCDWLEFIRGDITDSRYLNELPYVDLIIHAAGYAQPLKFMSDSATVIKMNTISTFSLIEKLNVNGKFLFLSSGAVYTGSTNLPFTESTIGCSNTNHPRAGYIEGKRCGEAIINTYRKSGIDAKSVRLSVTYGPGTRKGDKRVLSQIIQKGLDNRCIELLDDGSAEKVYLYISDAVELLWKILLFGKSDIYNVAGHSRTSIYNLALTVGEYLNVRVVKPNKRERGIEGAIPVDILDMSKTESEFHKSDYVSLSDGIRSTISFIKDMR